MMSDTDTSAAAVERLAVEAEAKADMYSVQHGIGARNARDTAATLRALLAERDAERVAREQWQSQVQSTVLSLLKAEAERDEAIQRGNDWCDQARKLRGERDRLREALRELLRVGVRVAGRHDRLFSADDEHPLFDTLDEWRTAADAARAALKETGHE
jgi:hypothetical protein